MKIIKNRLWYKMEAKFLTSCMIIYIEKNIATNFSSDSIIEDCKALKECKAILWLKIIFSFFNILFMINFMFHFHIYIYIIAIFF